MSPEELIACLDSHTARGDVFTGAEVSLDMIRWELGTYEGCQELGGECEFCPGCEYWVQHESMDEDIFAIMEALDNDFLLSDEEYAREHGLMEYSAAQVADIMAKTYLGEHGIVGIYGGRNDKITQDIQGGIARPRYTRGHAVWPQGGIQ
jgi:hypothetical protein